MRKFVIARIHYSGIFGGMFKDNILSDLSELQDSSGFIVSDGYHWTVGGIEQIDADGARVVQGVIAKIIPTQELTIVDEETKTESLTEASEVKDRESHFFIGLDSNLIALETSGMLTKKQLANVFIAGFLKIQKELSR